MQVTITSDEPIAVVVTCDKPNVIEAVGAEPVNVVVSVTKDGKSAYQSAVENGYSGTEEEWINRIENQNIDGGLIF